MANPELVLITDFDGYSGTKAYFLLLSDYLLRKGYHLEVYLAEKSALTDKEYNDFKNKDITFRILPKILLTNNPLLKRLRINKLLQFLFLLFLKVPQSHSLKILKSQSLKVLVSTGHSFYFLSGAWRWGRKFVYIQHTYPQGTPSHFTRYIKGIRSLYYRLMARRGFTFITVSKESSRINREVIGLSEKDFPVEVVYTPCQIKPLAPQRGSGKTVLTIGHMEPWKNPEFWLNVALQVTGKDPEAKFIWAGSGSLMQEIRKGIPNELEDRIELAGYQENVRGLLSAAAVYFQPSRVESLGTSVTEAMAFSLPCVVSNRGGLPELVDEGVTGYAAELDVETVSGIILSLLDHPETARKMGKAGHEKYLKEFSPEVWERRMDGLLFGETRA